MDKLTVIAHEKLNNYNLNFTIDNFQIIVHNFMVEDFKNIQGYIYHQHSCYELHYIKKGSGSVSYNDETHFLKPGDLFMFAPYTKHKQSIDTRGMTEYALRFDIKKLSAHSNNQTAVEESDQIIELLKKDSNTIFTNRYDIEELFEQAFTEANEKRPGFYISVKQRIMDIIIYTSRLNYDEPDCEAGYDFPTRSIAVSQIELITQYIRDNIDSHLTNKILADFLHLSERQLYRLIKSQFDLSPHQYVTELRINYVKHLLNK